MEHIIKPLLRDLLSSFGSSWKEELESWVALNSVVGADLLVLCAVDRHNLCFPLGVRVDLFCKLTPSRCKTLAVAAPRRIELHEQWTERVKIKQIKW